MPLITQTATNHEFVSLPSKDKLCQAFIGKPLSSLRTPAAIIDRSVFRNNCLSMANKVESHGLRFRAHVKTHKTVEGVEMQLKALGSRNKSVVCSTLMECWKIAESRLVSEGIVNDILYGMPLGLDRMQDAQSLSTFLKPYDAQFRVFVDSLTQIHALHEYAASQSNPEEPIIWSVMIKLDGGTGRAGLTLESEDLKRAIGACLDSPYVDLFGFYAHFGHSYNARTEQDAQSYLQGELEAINSAAKIALGLKAQRGGPPGRPYVLSFGATPTAHVAHLLGKETAYGELELHAGNYCCLDLQQVATSLVGVPDIAISVLSRVVSTYPDRDEALCDAGGIAMSKDTGPIPGYGFVVSPKKLDGWKLGRTSQEHGILTRKADVEGSSAPEIGEVIRIVGQHACMLLSNHPWYYVVENGGDTVVDVWVPWKGW